MNGRCIKEINKARCYQRIVCDPTRRCSNGCKFCYTAKFDPIVRAHVGEPPTFNIDTIDKQLSGHSRIIRTLKGNRVVRIGAMSDIVAGSPTSIRDYKDLIRLVYRRGYHPMIVTKTADSILNDSEFLQLLVDTNSILGVTTAYYNNNEATKLENITMSPPARRRELIGTALKMGINVVLRLNPMHPDFMDEHKEVLSWFSGVGGSRVILEVLRIVSSWAENMPGVDFSSYVTYGNGGFYNGYRTPHRTVVDGMYQTMIEHGHSVGIDKISICGDMDANDRMGYHHKTMDCCHASEIYNIDRSGRTWDED